MKIVQETAFSNKSYKMFDLLASYTAPRDMLVTSCVHTTTTTSGILVLYATVDDRYAGPVGSGWAPNVANVLCNGNILPLILESGQELKVYISSNNINDTDESGTVYIAELDTPTEDLYTASIERLRDDLAATAADEWSVLWHKNGVPLTSGVTDAKLTVTKRSDAGDLFTDQTLTAVGSTGAFKYDASGDERGSDGETLIAVATATIDGATRSFTEIIATDRIAVG